MNRGDYLETKGSVIDFQVLHPPAPLNFQLVSQCRDVPLGRGSEMFFVVAAEVGGIFVPDAETGARGVEVFAQHETTRFLEADLLLILQRGHRRDAFEMVMKARNAHPKLMRDLVYSDRLVEMLAKVRDGFRYSFCIAKR